MIPVASSFKLNSLMLAILIVSSTVHFIVFRVDQVVNIMLFDIVLFVSFIILFRDMLVIHLDGWIRLFLLMIFFQFFHNLFFSYDFFYSIKELVQSIELVIFYLILRIFLANQNNLNKVIEYVFYGLFLVAMVTPFKYYIPEIFSAIDFNTNMIQGMAWAQYLKPSSVVNQIIPIFILSFYYFKNYKYSIEQQILVFFILIFSIYIGVLAGSRTFQLLLLVIFLDYLFNKRRILLVTFLLIGISFLAIIYQDNISKKYTSEYAEKVSQTVEYITNDKPFHYYGFKQLMIIESPSNRERLHFLKLPYQVIKNNLFLGIGNKQLQGMTNMHGNLFIYFVAFGLFNLLILLALMLNLYTTSKNNLKVFSSPINRVQHYYFLYASVSFFFVSAGNFPMLPFIIAAALIKTTNEPRQSDFNNYYSIDSNAS
jgi:hypothetical protein